MSDGSRAIHAQHLSKVYRVYKKPFHRVLDAVHLGGPRHRDFWAVRNVYLDIERGATVGIIGENGAGKSTLLKLISGITAPTEGEIRVNGRVTSLIELGAGFHPEFSGRENISLSCSLLGMSGAEIAERTDSIIDFSELGEFVERPVKTYSSGMYVRLGFSVATCVEPDILLIDEALSVGDEHFRGKCMKRLNEFTERGGTTVFVSHDMGAIKSMCRHVVLMDQGEIVEQGSSAKVADEYLKRAHARGNERMDAAARDNEEYPRWGSGEMQIEEVTLHAGSGERSRVFQTGDTVTIRMSYRARDAARRPVFGVGVYRTDSTYVNGSNHEWRAQPIDFGEVPAGESGEVDVRIQSLPLLQGHYYLTAFLYDHSQSAPTAIDHREHVATFEVVDAERAQHGLVHLPTRWTVRRRRPGAAPETLESEA